MDTHSLGLYLRDAREAKELTLDDAVDRLKIRRGILQAFEDGDFTPNDASVVQIKGFLRNYAEYLGLEADLVIQYYDSATAPRRGRRRRERPPAKPPSQSRRASQEVPITPPAERPDTQSRRDAEKPDTMGDRRRQMRRRRSGILNSLIVIFVSLASITVILFVVMQLLETPASNLLPEINDNQATATPTQSVPTPVAIANTVDLPEFQEDFDGRGVALTVEVQQRMWMRLMIDGTERTDLSRLYVAGEVLNIPANSEVIVDTSNAAGLQLFYNGELLGSFGGRGERAEIAFRPEGVEVITANIPEPTAAPTETSTATPEPVTATLSPSEAAPIDDAAQVTEDIDLVPTTTDSATMTPLPTLTDIPLGTPEATATAEPSATLQITATSVDATEESAQPTDVIAPTEPAGPTPILPPRVTPSDPTPTKSAN